MPACHLRRDASTTARRLAAIGADAAAQRTIHSYRATLASALAKARAEGRKDVVDGVIQVLERWRSVDAMQNYTRMTPATYAEYVHIGTTTDAGSAVRDDIPTIEPTEHLAALADTVAELEATSHVPEGHVPALVGCADSEVASYVCTIPRRPREGSKSKILN